MPIHHFNGSLIESVEFTAPRRGLMHAHLIASANTSEEALTDLRGFLGSQSLVTLMDVKDGRTIIEVRGIKDDKGLLALLKQHNAVKGEPTVEMATHETQQKSSWMDSISDNSLFLSALFYDIGNVAYLVSGYQRGRHNKNGKFTTNDISEMMIGAAFSVGDVAMTFCSKDIGKHELIAVEEALKTHLKKKGIAIPQGNALSPDSLYESGAAQTIFEWVQKNIVQIKCATETTAGLFTIHSALKKGERNNFKLAGGFAITAGWLASCLMEKPMGHKIFDGNDPPHNLQEQIGRNPRGWLARPTAMANNIGTILGANKERLRYQQDFLAAQAAARLNPTADALKTLELAGNKRHDYVYNVVSSCAFLIATSLFGLSGSKRRPSATEDDEHVMNDMVLLAANMLADQPKETRDAAISEASDVVSRLSHITRTSNELEKMIHDKVSALDHSTWAARSHTHNAALSLQ